MNLSNSDLRSGPPDDVPKTIKEVERLNEGENVFSFENRFRCKDGTYRDFSWKSVPAGDKFYGGARDMTQQRLFESELVQTKHDAQAAAKVKSPIFVFT